MEFSLIVAMDQNRGIGKSGSIPWHLKGDLRHFREITIGDGKNTVIMGRKTWESIPEKFRPLPDRKNIVLSRTPLDVPAGVSSAATLDAAFGMHAGAGDMYVIGGGSVYAEAIHRPDCTKLFVTMIDADFDCDTRFPEIPPEFQPVDQTEPLTENDISYRFVTYQRT